MKKKETLNLIYYSPTGTTQKIVKEISIGLNIPQIKEHNLTTGPCDLPSSFYEGSLTIFGLPTYSGRLPANAVNRLQKLQGNHTPAVIVVVYGNRDFDDALLELKDLVERAGFIVIAAAVFVGEHSYSTPEKPIAQSRPDESDINKCHEFSQRITARITGVKKMEELITLAVPGHFPYKAPSKPPLLLSPDTDMEVCDMCGICADVCPTRAISLKDKPITDKALCTWCCACVKYCPHGARIFNNPTIDGIQKRLFANCSERKEPEFFV
jgi:ferredoxin